ncbi:MAG TPA: MFS transporter [Nocardioidaceae bacterium]|nr:MFS transporter [Nocardioidaceae bacterium]
MQERFAGHQLVDPAYRRISVALFAAGLATFAMLYSVQPLLPELAGDFEVSATESTLSLSLCTAALGVTLLFVGPVSEVVGRTRFIHLSLFASAIVGLLCAAAPSWPALLVLRTVEGVALAGLPAVGMAYLREEVHEGVHARAAGLYVAGTAMGGMSGRLIAGVLGDLGGWRFALGGVAVIALACAVLVRLVLPASRNFSPVPARPGQLVRMTGRLLTDPALLALCGIAATLMGAFVAVYNAMSFRLVGPPYQLSLAAAGLVFLVYPVGALSSTYAGALASRYGRRPVLPLCCLVTLSGLLLTLFASLALVVVGLAVMTAGFFGAHAVASGWVATRAHLGVGGTGPAASLYLFAYYLGSSVSTSPWRKSSPSPPAASSSVWRARSTATT